MPVRFVLLYHWLKYSKKRGVEILMCTLQIKNVNDEHLMSLKCLCQVCTMGPLHRGDRFHYVPEVLPASIEPSLSSSCRITILYKSAVVFTLTDRASAIPGNILRGCQSGTVRGLLDRKRSGEHLLYRPVDPGSSVGTS